MPRGLGLLKCRSDSPLLLRGAFDLCLGFLKGSGFAGQFHFGALGEVLHVVAPVVGAREHLAGVNTLAAGEGQRSEDNQAACGVREFVIHPSNRYLMSRDAVASEIGIPRCKRGARPAVTTVIVHLTGKV